MAKYWGLICPDHEEPGLWRNWLANRCVAVGWTPLRYRWTDDRDDWPRNREYLLEMTPGDVVIPYLGKYRFGIPGEIERLRVADADWNPTVMARHHGPAIHRGEPWLGRRIIVRWVTDQVPPANKIVRVPTDLQKRNPHGMVPKTIVPLKPTRLALFMNIINNEGNWEDYD